MERREEKDGGDEKNSTGNEKYRRRGKKAESERSKFESENRNSINYIVRLEKRVESERKDKDDRKRGRDILREKQCVGVVNSYALDSFDELWEKDEDRVRSSEKCCH